MHVADALSRAFLNETTEYRSLNQIVHSVSVSTARRQEIIDATKIDPELTELRKSFKNGWPADKTKVNPLILIYWKIRNQIYEEDELLFFDRQIIIPRDLRSSMIQKVHNSAHFGIQRTLSRAKEIMYWPGMTDQIINIVSKCTLCAKFQRGNIKEPLKPHEVPSAPFEKVGCDFCDFGGKNYLIVKDYFSKWLEIIETRTKTALEVVAVWRSLFATFGVPVTIIADNQPFGSFQCRQYAETSEINLVTSSPYYPKSNGMAERAVQTAKNILRKSAESNTSYWIALTEYRNTPLPVVKLSPAQIVFGRQLRTSSLISSQATQNQFSVRVKSLLSSAQAKMKQQYDQHTKSRPELAAGDKVYIQQHNREWKPGHIVRTTAQPRSYIVRNERGNLLRRNKTHLRLSHNFPFKPRNIDRNESDDEHDGENVDFGEGEEEGDVGQNEEEGETSQYYEMSESDVDINESVDSNSPSPTMPVQRGSRQTARRGRPFDPTNTSRYTTRSGRVVREPRPMY